jgi:RNA polymerase sigma-70 factor (sigma-E family)
MAEGMAYETVTRRPADPRRRDGFEEFVQATADRVHRAAVLLCGDHHLAEDLTQMTYAKVYSHWARVQSADSPLAYTRTILMRTFLSHRRLRSSAETPTETTPELPGSEPDFALRVDLLTAMRQLPPRDRSVLVLRYWEDLSVAETAEVLGIRETACRNRAARALGRLRAVLPDVTDAEGSTS